MTQGSVGSTSVLGTDGVLYRALTRWYELVLLSLAWIALSLPVVTLPVATGWLVDGVRRTGRGESIRGPRDTLSYFRDRWRRATGLALVHVLVIGLIIIGAFGPSPGGVLGILIMGVVVVVAATWALVAPWSLVTVDRYEVGDALRAAYLRALRHLPLSFLSAVAIFGGVAALIYAPAVVRLPLVLTVPGLVALIVITLCDRAAPSTSRAPAYGGPSRRGIR